MNWILLVSQPTIKSELIGDRTCHLRSMNSKFDSRKDLKFSHTLVEHVTPDLLSEREIQRKNAAWKNRCWADYDTRQIVALITLFLGLEWFLLCKN